MTPFWNTISHVWLLASGIWMLVLNGINLSSMRPRNSDGKVNPDAICVLILLFVGALEVALAFFIKDFST